MWRLSDETIMEYVVARHQYRRQFALTKVEQIEQNLRQDGWLLEDWPKSTLVRPVTAPGSDGVPPIHIHFDEEA